jgi:SAM-dependent methyltransferase
MPKSDGIKAVTIENEGVESECVGSCYLCASEGQVLYSALRDRLFGAPGRWDFRRCPACGLVWLDPRPVEQDLKKLYEAYYTHAPPPYRPRRTALLRKIIRDGILGTAFGYVQRASSNLERTAGHLFGWIGPLRDRVGGTVMWLDESQTGRLLDVGCGSGEFMVLMQNLGWDVMGLDPDPRAVEVARTRFGLNVRRGTIEEEHFPDSHFDVITMSHVIEHVHDPVATFKECRRILRNGGRIVVVTPNSGSLGHRTFRAAWRGLEPPRHLFLFSPGTLLECMDRAGLCSLKLSTSARTVPYIWHASLLLRQDSFHENPPEDTPLGSRLDGLVSWVVECLGLPLVRWGEEIVLHAEKPDCDRTRSE